MQNSIAHMVQQTNNYSVRVVCILNQADIQEDTIVDESCQISEEQLERRRTCIMHLSHNNVGLGKEVYEFCDLFSHSSEDIADAADFFINNLKGFSKDSQ